METDEDVQKSLGGEMSSIEQIMLEVDTDGDGQIDFYEFMEMMRDRKTGKMKKGLPINEARLNEVDALRTTWQ